MADGRRRWDLQALAEAQSIPDPDEISVAASQETIAAWFNAFGAGDATSVGAAFGQIAKENPEPVPVQVRRAIVESRLVTTQWPDSLKVTAVDADTGVLQMFDRDSGIELVDAVAASGAVPGVWPLSRINGRSWIDGGMVSSANASLADGYERVIVLAPMPAGFGDIPGVEEDVAALQERATVVLFSPDEQSILAIGPNPYDPSRRGPAAEAGESQGLRMAPIVEEMW